MFSSVIDVAMLRSEMLQNDINETGTQKQLAGGSQIASTVRIPKNLCDAAKKAARLHSISCSEQLRMCMENAKEEERQLM